MKKTYYSVLALFLVAKLIPLSLFAQSNPVPYAYTIKAEDLKKHLTFIASDSLKGRNTGSAEQKVAANYIAKHFKAVGLAPVQGSYFQKVDLVNRAWTNVSAQIKGKSYGYLSDFMAYALAPVAAGTKAPTVFAGYGVQQGTFTDFDKLKAKGAMVLVIDGEAKDQAGNYVLSGSKDPSAFGKATGWREKMKLAKAAGATGLIVITDKDEKVFSSQVNQRQAMMKRFGNERMVFKEDTQNKEAEFPVLLISSAMAAQLLGTDVAAIEAFKTKVSTEKKSVASKFKAGTIELKIENTESPVDTYNVVGFLEGTDKKSEVVVITAHYDHIGVSADGRINNGANDDGSGTVTVMELAEAFGKAAAEGHRPRRSILFMTVTGEEKGLLGSEYYSNHPLFPLANTVCDLNIDMVGRYDDEHIGKPDYIYEIGSDKLSSQLRAVLEEQNKKHIGLELDFKFNDPNDPNRFYYRSDHYNFAKHNIPVAFFFNGVHEDYHQPGDDIEKIEFDQIQKVGRLVFYMAWEISNREQRLPVDSNKP
ncbi:M28 family peptidase [Aquirufa ecclesiirivi]|uniref:M28 family peptidase n=1 Tax=Aquirufa ecclesiirivi TaxID=2715124 RepID=UPI003BAF560D